MKKLMAIMLTAVCALTMSACGQPDGEMFTLDALQSVQEAGAFSEELEELDADTAFMLYKFADYGMTREDLTDAAVLRSAGATCEEGAVLIFSDKDKAEAAGEAMGAYLDSQIEANESYRPNEIPKLEGAILQVEGNTVLMVVPNDAAAVRNLFEYQ